MITYEILPLDSIDRVRDLCNGLMAFQKEKAYLHKELFDNMSYETRLVPALKGAKHNHIVIARDGDKVIGYAYSTVSPKTSYTSGFATLNFGNFFDFDSVKGDDVGCLSQFFVCEEYRGKGVGSGLFDRSMEWLDTFDEIDDIFIFVSNGNDNAQKFYEGKGFKTTHTLGDGFITVLRNV